MPVVNPFEPLLTYAEDRLAVRRDNPKYLHLILAVTFLHQMQRPARHDADAGRTTSKPRWTTSPLPTNWPRRSLGNRSMNCRDRAANC